MLSTQFFPTKNNEQFVDAVKPALGLFYYLIDNNIHLQRLNKLKILIKYFNFYYLKNFTIIL